MHYLALFKIMPALKSCCSYIVIIGLHWLSSSEDDILIANDWDIISEQRLEEEQWSPARKSNNWNYKKNKWSFWHCSAKWGWYEIWWGYFQVWWWWRGVWWLSFYWIWCLGESINCDFIIINIVLYKYTP